VVDCCVKKSGYQWIKEANDHKINKRKSNTGIVHQGMKSKPVVMKPVPKQQVVGKIRNPYIRRSAMLTERIVRRRKMDTKKGSRMASLPCNYRLLGATDGRIMKPAPTQKAALTMPSGAPARPAMRASTQIPNPTRPKSLFKI